MNQERLKRHMLPVLLLSASLGIFVPRAGGEITQDLKQAEASLSWQSPAKLHRVVGKEKGDLVLGAEGIEFQSGKGRGLKWAFPDVQTFSLSPHRLVIETYRNRKRPLPGVQRYRFDLIQTIPPEIAAGLVREVQRPSRNAVPDPETHSSRDIPAHHRTRTGGTNGVLRFSEGGIDYVTSVPGDSRSWRWVDLQTLSNPDPYHLFVFGYRDTYTFDLKQPLSQALFNRLTDEINSHNAGESGGTLDAQAPEYPKSHGQRSWR